MKTGLDFLLAAKRCEIDGLQRLAFTANLVDVTARLVHHLQRERGLTNMVLASQGTRFIEARLAQSGEHLLQGFSAVDIAVGQAVYIGRHFRSTEGLARLEAWYGRITAREAFLRSLPGMDARLYTQEFYPAWPMPEA